MIGYLKLGAAVVVLGLLAWLGFIVNGWRSDAERLPLVEQARDQALADIGQYRTDLRDAQEASNGYQTELASLRTSAARAPTVPIRLCPRPRVPEPRPIPPTGSGPAPTAPPSGDIPQDAGLPRDIGPGLYEIADRADELSAQVRGLQEYARSCSGGTASDSEDTATLNGLPIVEPVLEPPPPVNPWDRLSPRPTRRDTSI